MKYSVKVKEVLLKVMTVDANSKEEALEKVMKMYKKQEIVLDYEDLVDTSIN